ncbi:hypothetical protein DRQ25_00850 [Candidatus Fermentibacteria bacterium]|nr:MAG: hypothetical protein DRQ25_00850 [Candidatus Fermentibacteria bacterium]
MKNYKQGSYIHLKITLQDIAFIVMVFVAIIAVIIGWISTEVVKAEETPYEIQIDSTEKQDRVIEEEKKDSKMVLANTGMVASISDNTVASQNIREVTAYNVGDVAQTDDTPCIGAWGDDLCEMLDWGIKVCASNSFAKGTHLNIKHYGECIVLDRMNSRYTNRIDIAMKLTEKERAIKFGLQKLEVTELK